MITPFDSWACPLDALPMKRIGNSLICPNNHVYDYARAGYIHLLPVQLKKSHAPGDNKEMVQARCTFLNTGMYTPILNTATQVAKTYIAKHPMNRRFVFIDAGCGEGYYTVGLIERLQMFVDKNISVLGFDISREAIMAAAKRNKKFDWAVATNKKIPVIGSGADGVFSLFGFPVWSEFERVVKKGGFVAVADTGKNHLIELRRCVYKHVIVKEADMHTTPSGFMLMKEVPVRYQLSEISFEIADALLKMTPHYYRMTAEKYDSFRENPPRAVTIDTILRLYKRL